MLMVSPLPRSPLGMLALLVERNTAFENRWYVHTYTRATLLCTVLVLDVLYLPTYVYRRALYTYKLDIVIPTYLLISETSSSPMVGRTSKFDHPPPPLKQKYSHKTLDRECPYSITVYRIVFIAESIGGHFTFQTTVHSAFMRDVHRHQ